MLGLLCEDELDVAGVAHVGCKVNKKECVKIAIKGLV